MKTYRENIKIKYFFSKFFINSFISNSINFLSGTKFEIPWIFIKYKVKKKKFEILQTFFYALSMYNITF